MIGSVVFEGIQTITMDEREHLNSFFQVLFFEPFFIYYNIILESLKIVILTKDGTVTGGYLPKVSCS